MRDAARLLLRFLRLTCAQQLGSQRLERVPEPSAVTDDAAHVLQYDRVMTTRLALLYACGLEVIHRARPDRAGGAAADIACGPGHFALCLARYLDYEHVTGIDLSPGMVEAARQNAARVGLAPRVRFAVGDALELEGFRHGELDVATFMQAAHHLPDLNSVSRVLRSLDRITRPDGLIVVTDLARLRTAPLTERYVKAVGGDYRERGVPQFLEDFRHSMYAAWTPAELRQAIPADSRRYWCHLVPRGLPTAQVLLGLPVGRRQVFVRSGLPWRPADSPVPRDMGWEWNLLRWGLALGCRRQLGPRA
jgi:ubiquinone/menaquinone biosynthesis C-methylase UbiE